MRSIRRGIEVVITGLTRNQFACKGTQVRILSSPPCLVDKNAVHCKTLKNDEFFRVFLLFLGQKRDFYAS